MANTNAPYGFRPSRHLMGGVVRPNSYRIADAYNTAIYQGDPVKLVTGGTIELAAAGDRILGIFHGCNYVNAAGDVVFDRVWVASTDLPGSSVNYAEALVYDDPNILFEAQSAGTPAVSSIGTLADHVAGTADTLLKRSGAGVSGTMATTTAGFRIVDFVRDPRNEIGQYARLLVQIFEHEFAEHGQATPGV